jgi:hypothetical protein
MDKSLDVLLKELRDILIAESQAQDALKDIKVGKEAVLDKLNDIIKADNFANEFVTLRKRPKIEVLDEQIAIDFMKDIKRIDREKVEDYFYSGKTLPGLRVELKLIAFKKKSGLF